MLGFYLFALVLGGGFLLFSLLGDVLGGDASDVDMDAGGADPDPGTADVDAGHDASPADGDAPFKILSLRTVTYFLFGVGGVGTLMTVFMDAPILTAALSFLTGLAAATLVATTFGWLARTESGAREEGEDLFVGLPARVTLPLSPGRRGKVLVRRGERTFELMARPYDSDAVATDMWREVVVVEMDRGTALVTPMEDMTAEIPSRSES